jgi:RecA DNA recombination protein
MTVDQLLRQGAVTEIVGPLCSGRTSLLAACLREVAHAGGAAALIDADDAFDPASAARAGVDLRRVLWVRCGGRRDAALRAADLLVRCPGFALVALDVGESPPRISLAQAFRLRLAVRRGGAALVVVARRRVLGAGATLVVETRRRGLAWAGPRLTPTRLAGAETAFRVLRRQGAEARGGGVVAWSA